MENNLPKGWAKAIAKDLADYINGRAFKPTEWKTIGVPIIRIQNLNDSNATFNFCDFEVPKKYYVQNGDLLFAWSGTPGTSFGAHIWRGNRAVLNQHIFKIDLPQNGIDRKFFYYELSWLVNDFIKQAHGTAGLAHITKQKFENTFIPVPPLPEQYRIASKLDKLMGKTERSKKRLEKIPLILIRFRQSVLAAAVDGKLTEGWRKKNKIIMAWQKKSIKEVVNIIGGSQPPKSTFEFKYKKGYIRLIQIRDYKSDNHLTFIPENLARRKCSKKDVMIGRYGPPLFQILRGIEGAYNVALMKAVPLNQNELDNNYLFYLLQYPTLKNYIIHSSERTVGQDGVRKDLLEEYEIEVPPIKEQHEIVRRVEALFAFADKIEARYTKAKAQFDKLPQSILAKAFRGELVPQDPDDEPASVLLERIREEKKKMNESKRGKKKKEVENAV